MQVAWTEEEAKVAEAKAGERNARRVRQHSPLERRLVHARAFSAGLCHVQNLEAARAELKRKDAAKTQLDSQIQELRSQHESQTQHQEGSVEDLGLQLAQLQREQTAQNAQVPSHTPPRRTASGRLLALNLSVLCHRQIQEKQQELQTAEAREVAENASMKEKRAEMDKQLRLHATELKAQERCVEKVQVGDALGTRRGLLLPPEAHAGGAGSRASGTAGWCAGS